MTASSGLQVHDSDFECVSVLRLPTVLMKKKIARKALKVALQMYTPYSVKNKKTLKQKHHHLNSGRFSKYQNIKCTPKGLS